MKKIILYLLMMVIMVSIVIAGDVTYNTVYVNSSYIYRYNSTGYSANLGGTTDFDYFTDYPAVDDAIYFSTHSNRRSDINLSVGTAMTGTDIVLVWEYYHHTSRTWVDIEDLQDETINLTVVGNNIVRFPIQMQNRESTIDGHTYPWYRLRLDSFTTVTEGGSNNGSQVSQSDGYIRLNDYTEESPCTFTIIFNYMATNYGYISLVHHSNYFGFQKVGLSTDTDGGYLSTKNEVIEYGADEGTSISPYYGYAVQWSLHKIRAGTKLGDSHGIHGSTIIINANANTYPLSWSSDVKAYGSQFIGGKGHEGQPGYIDLTGEFLDCTFSIAPKISSGILKNSVFYYIVWLGFNAPADFTGSTLIPCGTGMYMYYSGWKFRDADFTYCDDAGNSLININSMSDDDHMIFLNPKSQLGSEADANPPVYMATPSIINWATVFYYNDSAGTYIDYTTEFNDVAENDTPIYGDVNDCYYFRLGVKSNSGMHLEIESELTSNDYVYNWSYYRYGWRNYAREIDQTDNFVNNGTKWWFLSNIDYHLNYLISTTVNGQAGYWFKMCITTKGTGSPIINRLRGRASSGGVSDWRLSEEYTVDMTFIDENSQPIEGATVTITDSDGLEVTNVNTNANGQIPQQEQIRKKFYFDPVNPVVVGKYVGEKTMGNYTFNINKDGYKSIEFNYTLSNQKDWTIPMSSEPEWNQIGFNSEGSYIAWEGT